MNAPIALLGLLALSSRRGNARPRIAPQTPMPPLDDASASNDPDPLGNYAAQRAPASGATQTSSSYTIDDANRQYGPPSGDYNEFMSILNDAQNPTSPSGSTSTASYDVPATTTTTNAPATTPNTGSGFDTSSYSPSGRDAAYGLRDYYQGGGRDRSIIAGYQRVLNVYPDGIVGPITRAAAQRYGVTL